MKRNDFIRQKVEAEKELEKVMETRKELREKITGLEMVIKMIDNGQLDLLSDHPEPEEKKPTTTASRARK
jgi:hypothetical protein